MVKAGSKKKSLRMVALSVSAVTVTEPLEREHEEGLLGCKVRIIDQNFFESLVEEASFSKKICLANRILETIAFLKDLYFDRWSCEFERLNRLYCRSRLRVRLLIS